MLVEVLLFILAIIIGMAISIIAFGTGGRKKKVFQDIYFSIEDALGIGIVYTKTGEYSAIIRMDNPVEKFSADKESYYVAANLFNSIAQALGEGYALHKQDIFSLREFLKKDDKNLGFLSRSYFKHFKGRSFLEAKTYLTITLSSTKSKLFSFDSGKWQDFMLKISKVKDILTDAGLNVEFLSAKECQDYVSRFFAFDFEKEQFFFDNFKASDKHLLMGEKKIKVFSLIDIDAVGLPQELRPYTNIEVNSSIMPQALLYFIDSIPGAETVIYNQIIFSANQKRELAILEKKKNRHASMPSASNHVAVEDIKSVQEAIARQGKELVYVHFNLIVSCKKDVDINTMTNHLENMFSRVGIHISKRSYNQLELFISSFPGNCFSLSKDYDRFLTLSDAASCLFYSERRVKEEDTPLKMYYTDRGGIPIAIDITGKEGKHKLTDNSNFFCLGPSGSGKSFHINSMIRQLHEQGTDVVMVDTGDSYEGLCSYLGGKYISYTKE